VLPPRAWLGWSLLWATSGSGRCTKSHRHAAILPGCVYCIVRRAPLSSAPVRRAASAWRKQCHHGRRVCPSNFQALAPAAPRRHVWLRIPKRTLRIWGVPADDIHTHADTSAPNQAASSTFWGEWPRATTSPILTFQRPRPSRRPRRSSTRPPTSATRAAPRQSTARTSPPA
jgi:hypothetical protein